MKAKTIKARVMYQDKNGFLWDNRNPGHTPAFVLPATREAYEGMVEQGAEKIAKDGMHEWGMDYYRSQARSVLASINIKEPKA